MREMSLLGQYKIRTDISFLLVTIQSHGVGHMLFGSITLSLNIQSFGRMRPLLNASNVLDIQYLFFMMMEETCAMDFRG
jgi:hypothetical protein